MASLKCCDNRKIDWNTESRCGRNTNTFHWSRQHNRYLIITAFYKVKKVLAVLHYQNVAKHFMAQTVINTISCCALNLTIIATNMWKINNKWRKVTNIKSIKSKDWKWQNWWYFQKTSRQKISSHSVHIGECNTNIIYISVQSVDYPKSIGTRNNPVQKSNRIKSTFFFNLRN